MAEICPDCEVEMKEEHFTKPFGNPIEIAGGIMTVMTEVCPKCGLRVVSEENLGVIKKAIREEEEKLKC